MISVLIPVYNFDVTGLVTDLKLQLAKEAVDYEIIILDDASSDEYRDLNCKLAEQSKVRYIALSENAGRVKARQELAKYSQYNWILFLDADSIIVDARFINTYLNAINENRDVITGGRIYIAEMPVECSLRLHWKYGRYRESQVGARTPNAYKHFMSNNFLIRKELFNRLDFQIPISGYGNEDTWMGIQLERWNASLMKIDNPVLHDGLEQAGSFIEKINNAIRNLKRLSEVVELKTLQRHSKLFNLYLLLEKYKCKNVLSLFYSIISKKVEKKLKGCNPSLLLFDLYKLNVLIRIMKSKA